MRTIRRRRKEGKTDYRARETMLKSGVLRIVFRKTNKYIIGQYVESKQAKDSIVIGLNSGKLISYGWPKEIAGSLKSLPAAYLTGFLLGKKIKDRDDKAKGIFDIGLLRNIMGSREYAFLNGVVDSGVDVPHKKGVFPSQERIKGANTKYAKKIEEIFTKVMEKIENEHK